MLLFVKLNSVTPTPSTPARDPLMASHYIWNKMPMLSAPVPPYTPTTPLTMFHSFRFSFTSGSRQILLRVRNFASALHQLLTSFRTELKCHFLLETPSVTPHPPTMESQYSQHFLSGPCPSVAPSSFVVICLVQASFVYYLSQLLDSIPERQESPSFCSPLYTTFPTECVAHVRLSIALCKMNGQENER